MHFTRAIRVHRHGAPSAPLLAAERPFNVRPPPYPLVSARRLMTRCSQDNPNHTPTASATESNSATYRRSLRSHPPQERARRRRSTQLPRWTAAERPSDSAPATRLALEPAAETLASSPVAQHGECASCPAPATSADGNGVGIAVSTVTMRPFPTASPSASCPRCWMKPTATPRAIPTGTDAVQPTPPVAIVPPKSIESTATTPTAGQRVNTHGGQHGLDSTHYGGTPARRRQIAYRVARGWGQVARARERSAGRPGAAGPRAALGSWPRRPPARRSPERAPRREAQRGRRPAPRRRGARPSNPGVEPVERAGVGVGRRISAGATERGHGRRGHLDALPREPFGQHPVADDLDRLAGRDEPGRIDAPPPAPVAGRTAGTST